jgi:uncharacterized membrane protein
MLITLKLLVCIGAGIIGGVFFAFSVFVMKALAALPPHQGIGAMQRINVTVLNPRSWSRPGRGVHRARHG